MQSKLILSAIAGCVLLTGSALAKAPKARITMDEAQAIALKRAAAGGTVSQADTATRHGKQVYSIFIDEGNGITAHEVVSSRGKILRRAIETPATAKIK